MSGMSELAPDEAASNSLQAPVTAAMGCSAFGKFKTPHSVFRAELAIPFMNNKHTLDCLFGTMKMNLAREDRHQTALNLCRCCATSPCLRARHRDLGQLGFLHTVPACMVQ